MKKNKTKLPLVVGIILFAILVGYVAWLPSKPETEKGFIGGFFQDVENAFEDATDEAGEFLLWNGYKAFMSWLEGGVSGGFHRLPSSLRQTLKPYYRNDLKKIRVAATTRIENLAITDCTRVYFSDSNIVRKLKNGSALTRREFSWLAHELTHTEQCYRKGSRRAYALRWFGEIEDVIEDAVASGDFDDIISDITSAQKLAKYDNNMSMEIEAERRSEEVTKKAFK